MPKLNQLLAIEKGVKNRQNQVITEAYHKIQKANLFSGIARKFTPVNEDGEQLPPENQLVQERADALLNGTANAWAELINITSSKDDANTSARADVVVDGVTVLKQVPTTTLLFLEKQLVDLHTFISKLPKLDPTEKWEFSNEQNCFATEPAKTRSTKKVMRNHVLAKATDKHPEQVQVYTEDVTVGHWDTTKYSGAYPAKKISELLEKVEKLQRAVHFARETANTVDAPVKTLGQDLFGYLLG